MQAIDKQHFSHEEYFALEEQEQIRYEYMAGEVFAMTGGTVKHSLISVNCLSSLANLFKNTQCNVFNSDLKLKIPEHDKFCYPDVMLLYKDTSQSNFIEEPELIIEVLSESTESYDRGLKFEHYRSIKKLKYYLLVSQERVHVELYFRQDEKHWILSEFTEMDESIKLDKWQMNLPLSEIYYHIDFNQE